MLLKVKPFYRKGDWLHSNVIKCKRILRYCPLYARNPPVTDGFPSQRDGNTDLWCFCVVCLNYVEQTLDWPVIRDGMTVIWYRRNLYDFVCVCASITKYIGVSKPFSTNITKLLPINPQKGKLQAYNKFIVREIFKVWWRSQCWHITFCVAVPCFVIPYISTYISTA